MSRMKVINSNVVGYYSYTPDIEIKRYENGKEVLEDKQVECVICKRNLCEPSYETISDNKSIFRETEITLGKCGHLFHSDCIDTWLKKCDTCPIDRVKWCRHRELDTTVRFVLNNNKKGYKNNYNSSYNQTNWINKEKSQPKQKVVEVVKDDSEDDGDY